jgi:hypothetical protein
MSKEDNPKYFICSKCGEVIRKVPNPSKIDLTNMTLCVNPMGVRTSGICGGSVTVEITEEEYNTKLKEWEIKTK